MSQNFNEPSRYIDENVNTTEAGLIFLRFQIIGNKIFLVSALTFDADLTLDQKIESSKKKSICLKVAFCK